MKIIAHRANLSGPDPATENTPAAIDTAIAMGFDCEIDVWAIDGVFYLGHDYPAVQVSRAFLQDRAEHLWVHCKHLDSLLALKDSMNCFYHDKDLYTLTSKGFVWGNINSPCNPHAIQVLPERSGCFSTECAGVCTDFPIRYKALLK